MSNKLEILSPLLKRLSPLVKKQGLKRESDEWDMAIFSRKRGKDIQRVGLGVEKSRNRKGEFEFAVLVGVEFREFPIPTRHGRGLPRTHECDALEYMFERTSRNQIRCKLACCDQTDWGGLASEFSEWISAGLEELESRREKLRASYVSRVATAGRNNKKSLAIFAERKQKELRKRKSKGKQSAHTRITETINIFEIACRLLRAKNDKIEELKWDEFDDEGDAHDQTILQQKQGSIIEDARWIQTALESAHLPAAETGDTEHAAIPVNGVLYFAIWQIGWKYLYVVASHEDTELPVYLLIGTTGISHAAGS